MSPRKLIGGGVPVRGCGGSCQGWEPFALPWGKWDCTHLSPTLRTQISPGLSELPSDLPCLDQSPISLACVVGVPCAFRPRVCEARLRGHLAGSCHSPFPLLQPPPAGPCLRAFVLAWGCVPLRYPMTHSFLSSGSQLVVPLERPFLADLPYPLEFLHNAVSSAPPGPRTVPGPLRALHLYFIE